MKENGSLEYKKVSEYLYLIEIHNMYILKYA